MNRPDCSRCQALHTKCGYNAEEGETRWSALHRRNRELERERDEARDLIAHMQSRPQPAAQEIFHHIRSYTHASDLGAFIHETTNAISGGTLQQQSEHRQPCHYQQLERNHKNMQYRQRQLPQQQCPNTFFQPGPTTIGSTYELPPLRSIVGVPPAGINETEQQRQKQQQQPSQPLLPSTQRKMSQLSSNSSGLCRTLSSFG
jgi:hypothetical protein